MYNQSYLLICCDDMYLVDSKVGPRPCPCRARCFLPVPDIAGGASYTPRGCCGLWLLLLLLLLLLFILRTRVFPCAKTKNEVAYKCVANSIAHIDL